MVNQFSPIPDKVALFLSIFRGRADVFPRRFQNIPNTAVMTLKMCVLCAGILGSFIVKLNS